MHVNDLLKIAVDNGASDLHLKVGSFPMMRVRGVLQPATEEKKLDHEDVVAMSAHCIVREPGQHQHVLEHIHDAMRLFGIQHVTIQLERDEMLDRERHLHA